MHISSLFNIDPKEQIKLIRPPLRKDIVKQFVEKLNLEIEQENIKNKLFRKPWKPSFIAFKLSHLKVDDLFYFLSVCNQSKSFGRCFWFNLKEKEKEERTSPQKNKEEK